MFAKISAACFIDFLLSSKIQTFALISGKLSMVFNIVGDIFPRDDKIMLRKEIFNL